MQLIADLHLHSKYSRAVSPQMVVPEIAKWARRKGIGLVGAPDWTHPLWLRELRGGLKEAADGLFACRQGPEEVYFLLSTEISSIYNQGNKTRRIHNLIIVPSFEVAEKINTAFRNKGVNLLSDGRPITGLSTIEICELVFSIWKDALIIPCHVWTPWFSLYGSKSGFDSLKECFGEFANQVYAVETGLSSDPAMNWRIEELDSRAILSFSDAHSPPKMSREATVFEISDQRPVISYQQIKEAIIGSPVTDHRLPRIAYTIEFYPQEGKYHFTGHRKCEVKHSPEETKKLGRTCPVCGRELTVGVMHRVEELATRNLEEVKIEETEIGNGLRGIGWQNRPPYVMLVPLIEILSESLGSGVSSQTVETEYNRLTTEFESEFNVLLKVGINEIARISGEKVAESVLRVRSRQVSVDPGYDGVFGTVKIWPFSAEGSEEEDKKQMSLF